MSDQPNKWSGHPHQLFKIKKGLMAVQLGYAAFSSA
jgi:hypothetical protein